MVTAAAEALRAEVVDLGPRGRGQRYRVEFRRRAAGVALAMRSGGGSGTTGGGWASRPRIYFQSGHGTRNTSP